MGIFMVGAGVTGVAGALFAHHFNYVGPTQFELDATILFLVMLIVGGQFSLTGATLGALLTVGLLEALRFALDNVFVVPFELTAHLRQVAFAGLLIATLAWRGQGLVPERLPKHRRAGGATATADPIVKPMTPLAVRDPLLRCAGLRKSFGGVDAVTDASFTVRAGEIVALIGPNGAGKTSTFNILSGIEQGDGGQAWLGDTSILGKSSAEIARLGLARTFQDVRVWPRLTLIENLLAVQDGGGLQLTTPRLHLETAWALLHRFDLLAQANMAADQLSYAQRKMLSLARIACFDPAVMLLDEPTSGVDPRRLDIFVRQIEAFARRDRKAVCIIEHNMSVVRALADRVVFMDGGRVIASGAPRDILGDGSLMRVYLGHREMEAA
jgi:branched-chain amino acid transport system permease protein